MEALVALGLLVAAALYALVAALAWRNRGRRRRPLPPSRLRYLPAPEADRRGARRASWFTGRYKGGPTNQEWHAGRRLPTRRGERVRSYEEVRIADYLHARQLRYVYEPGICGFRPDFYLPDYGIIVEYWGTHHKGHPVRRRKTRAFLRGRYRLVSLEPGKPVSLEDDLRRQLYYKMQE